jgi:hypothetical protein
MSVDEVIPDKLAESPEPSSEHSGLRSGVASRVDWRKLRWALQAAQVRLRFLVVLAAAFLVVGKWHVLRNYWDRFTTPTASGALGGGVSTDTEYFCPMCPGVVSTWPSKCSVCNMPLVRRRKGAAVQLPDGVVARMQLSPYRVQLAGIHTSQIGYLPLTRSAVAIGRVRAKVQAAEPGLPDDAEETGAATIDANLGEQDLLLAVSGADCSATSDALPGHEPWRGQVIEVEREVSGAGRVKVVLSVADPEGELWPGMRVQVRIERPIAELEPFRSQPADPPPLAKGELRTLYVCPDHPQVVRGRPGECPEDGNPLAETPLNDLQRVGWWCPMHPKVTAHEPGHECEECNGMKLLPRIVNYRPAGQVLAVPEGAVIDSGERRVAYVETMPGMFDGVEVAVGPRCDGFYPVLSGLAPGQRVATAGAFLIDAETRLNPSIAASYFGATRAGAAASESSVAPSAEQESKGDDEAAEIRKALAQLPAADRQAAERQKICPVTGLPLGSMGAPIKAAAGKQTVWLCCEGCEASFAKDPAKHLKKLSASPKP